MLDVGCWMLDVRCWMFPGFMESPLSRWRMKWDHEPERPNAPLSPTLAPSEGGMCLAGSAAAPAAVRRAPAPNTAAPGVNGGGAVPCARGGRAPR